MIAYFPSFYPDELLYSLLSRYYVNAGYMVYTHAAQDILEKKTAKPNIEFINKYTTEMKHLITQGKPFEEVIEKHTMFPYYVRFLNLERRRKAMQLMLEMDEKYCDALCFPKRSIARYVRYCPLCAEEDREMYGETYWHRNHQIFGCEVCAKHCCKLISTNIAISSVPTPAFLSAEETVPQRKNVTIVKNTVECQLAKYVIAVFQAEVDMTTDIPIGVFLHSKLEYTKYVSRRGEQRNLKLLHQEFTEYYKTLPYCQFTECWQLQKVFNNRRFNCYEICMLAMFLGISVEELTHMKLPEKAQYQMFDVAVKELHNTGLNYMQIAEKMDASYNVVKPVGEGRYAGKRRV